MSVSWAIRNLILPTCTLQLRILLWHCFFSYVTNTNGGQCSSDISIVGLWTVTSCEGAVPLVALAPVPPVYFNDIFAAAQLFGSFSDLNFVLFSKRNKLHYFVCLTTESRGFIEKVRVLETRISRSPIHSCDNFGNQIQRIYSSADQECREESICIVIKV